MSIPEDYVKMLAEALDIEASGATDADLNIARGIFNRKYKRSSLDVVIEAAERYYLDLQA